MGIVLEPGAEPIPGYTLQSRLGRGGFGEVWKATGPGKFQVALKFVHLDEAVGTVELRSLDLIKDIRHPHLLATFGSWQIENTLVIAMELAERTLLDRYREAVGQGFEGIPAPEILELFLEAAKGLDYLNEPRHPSGGKEPLGIQHRDIKPQNLLLVGGSVKVADFGLARVLQHTETGHTGSMTPAYAAPEFFNRTTSSQSDQYSLAVAYCHMRGGRLPYDGNPMEIVAGHLMHAPDLSMLPPTERRAVARALAKDPKDRWPSCRAFVGAIGDGGSIEDGLDAETLGQQSRVGQAAVATTAPNSASRAGDRPSSSGIEEGTGYRDRRAGTDHRADRRRVPRGALIGISVCLLGFVALLTAGQKARQGRDGSAMPPTASSTPHSSVSRSPSPVVVEGGKPKNTRPDVDGNAPKSVLNSIGMKLILIPSGEFSMGSSDNDKYNKDNEKPLHRVRITRPFYLGATEVTQGQFRAVTSQNPSKFKESDELPVESVPWIDAAWFCNVLSEHERLDAFYRFDGDEVTVSDWQGEGYRLPTEAEWEYACRAGSQTAYNFGDDPALLTEFAWTAVNSGRERFDPVLAWNNGGGEASGYFRYVLDNECRTHPVAQKRPNAFGLYDMHGNVFEWCWDWYDPSYYRQSPAADPTGPSKPTTHHYRGGSWMSDHLFTRSATRGPLAPGAKAWFVGFRVCRGLSRR